MSLRRTDIVKTKDRAQSCETTRGWSVDRFSGRKKSGRLVEEKREWNYLPAKVHGDIRRTFCAHCRSESRTCLMELEPFWKFDRREQPASRSSVPPLRSPAVVFFRSYSFSSLTPNPSSFSISRIPLRIRVAFPTLIWFRVLLFSSSIHLFSILRRAICSCRDLVFGIVCLLTFYVSLHVA